jgi:hypothetical protein
MEPYKYGLDPRRDDVRSSYQDQYPVARPMKRCIELLMIKSGCVEIIVHREIHGQTVPDSTNY